LPDPGALWRHHFIPASNPGTLSRRLGCLILKNTPILFRADALFLKIIALSRNPKAYF
jgi:hypothetical protein